MSATDSGTTTALWLAVAGLVPAVVLAMIRNVAIDGRRYPRPDRRRPASD